MYLCNNNTLYERRHPVLKRAIGGGRRKGGQKKSVEALDSKDNSVSCKLRRHMIGARPKRESKTHSKKFVRNQKKGAR